MGTASWVADPAEGLRAAGVAGLPLKAIQADLIYFAF